MRFSVFSLIIAIMVLPLSARADNKYYASITGEYIADARANGNLTANDVSIPGSVAFTNGLGGLAALGYYINPNIRTEVELGYRELKEKSDSVSLYGNTYTTGSNSRDRAITEMANIYYDLPTGSNVTPYIGIGMGGINETTNDGGNAFAYQGMLGLNYKVSDTSTIFGGYRYFATSNLTSTYTAGDCSFAESEKVKASSIDVGYRYNF